MNVYKWDAPLETLIVPTILWTGPNFWQKSNMEDKIRLHAKNQLPRCSGSGLKVYGGWGAVGWPSSYLGKLSNLKSGKVWERCRSSGDPPPLWVWDQNGLYDKVNQWSPLCFFWGWEFQTGNRINPWPPPWEISHTLPLFRFNSFPYIYMLNLSTWSIKKEIDVPNAVQSSV